MNKTIFLNGLIIGLILANLFQMTRTPEKVEEPEKASPKIIVETVDTPVPITVASREPMQFKQIGLLFNKHNEITLPLFGKQLYRGSVNWNYYTYVNKYNQLMLPLEIDNKDCMSDIGCKELYDNDTVYIPSYGNDFTVKLYNKDII